MGIRNEILEEILAATGGGGATSSDSVSNGSTVSGVTVTDALDTLNAVIAAGVDGALVDVPSDVSTSIPFSAFPTTLASFTATAAGDYRFILSVCASMSSASRSWFGEFRLNGQPLAGLSSPYYSEEFKDSSDRKPMTFQRRITLTTNDVVSFVFGPESSGSTATIRGGSQLETLKVDI